MTRFFACLLIALLLIPFALSCKQSQETEQPGPAHPSDQEKIEKAKAFVEDFEKSRKIKESNRHGTKWKRKLERSRYELKVTIDREKERVIPAREFIAWPVITIPVRSRMNLRGFLLKNLLDDAEISSCKTVIVGVEAKNREDIPCLEIFGNPEKWLLAITKMGTVKLYDTTNPTSPRQKYPRHIRWIDIETR